MNIPEVILDYIKAFFKLDTLDNVSISIEKENKGRIFNEKYYVVKVVLNSDCSAGKIGLDVSLLEDQLNGIKEIDIKELLPIRKSVIKSEFNFKNF